MPEALARAATSATTPSFSPLYRQIKALILRSMQGGEWKPGEAIPSEIELAARFKVSQGTVRKAIDELAADNLLLRRQGKGTYVSTHVEAGARYRFLRLQPDVGPAGPMRRRFLDCRRLAPPPDVATALALSGTEHALRVRRLLLAANEPIVLDDIWLPATPFEGLTAERLGAYRGPMYALFETEFDTHMVRAEEKIRAVSASADDAQLLAVQAGAPLLSVERLSFTYGDRAVELRRGLYHTASHHYRNELG